MEARLVIKPQRSRSESGSIPYMKWARLIALACVATVAIMPTHGAHAANGAFAVDAADISEVGSCKLESWISTATNTDFSLVANPSCVVDVGKPMELSMLSSRSRSDGDWSTAFQPKAKTNLVPTGIGKVGFSIYGGSSFDVLTGDNLGAFAVVPVTYRISETMRINLNGGWLWDRILDRNYLTYGIGWDWKFTDVLQLTVEAFGQAGPAGVPSITKPRFQTGVRYRPNDVFSIDLIYGRNIQGENANWITLGTTIRFPPPESTPKRVGNL